MDDKQVNQLIDILQTLGSTMHSSKLANDKKAKDLINELELLNNNMHRINNSITHIANIIYGGTIYVTVLVAIYSLGMLLGIIWK